MEERASKGILDRWGGFVHRRRVAVLLGSLLVLAASAAALAAGGTLVSYQRPEGTESSEAADLLEKELPRTGDTTLLLVISHPTWRTTDTAFRDAAETALAEVRRDARVTDVRTPYDGPAPTAAALTSRDGHRILAIVTLADDLETARDYLPEVRGKIADGPLDIKETGFVAVYSEMNEILDSDLKRSEAVSLPLTLLLLLLVFGSVVAATLPLGVGLLAVAGGLAGVFVASRFFDVSLYAVNIVTLIGLGVAIDYSLFMVSRYREERAQHDDERALRRTLATAGRATFFSGLTVAIGLLGLQFYSGLYFATMGMAGGIVVGFAVLYALTFLPALLAILGPRIDRGRVPLPRRARAGSFWGTLARWVMRRPVVVLVPTLALLLAAGIPFLSLHMGSDGVNQLPEDAESRVGFELLRAEFPDQGANEITLVVQYAEGAPLSRERVGALHDFTRAVAATPGVSDVRSIVDLDDRLQKSDYQDTYAQPRARLPAPIREMVDATVGESIVVIDVRTPHDEASAEARALVDALRAMPEPEGARVLVAGATAVDNDMIGIVYDRTPIAVAFIVVTTYLLLLLQTGSVILPLKALVMNLLSIAASFGALVWVFQMGNLSAVLDFTPSAIDPSLPVLLFCIVFGLSMDYEVLLLSRMHEEYERTGDNTQAVASGLEKSGRLITSAAAIMVVVFASFGLAQVTLIKALGLALALAILVDATIVRALVVPSTMRLMGKWNWWAPAFVTRWYKALG